MAENDVVERLHDLLQREQAETCGVSSQDAYLAAHERRFADIVDLCREFVPSPAARVLDIGRSELTVRLRMSYRNISSLGLSLSSDDGGHRERTPLDEVEHIVYDLQDAACLSTWPVCGPFDLIVFSEVLEHLHVAPEFVLGMLGSLLSVRGLLVCTTPNATALRNRLRLLCGTHPYERLRLFAENPGHIREYTGLELQEIAAAVGLQCVHHRYEDWPQRSRRSVLRRFLISTAYAAGGLRPSQTIVLSRQA